MSQQLFFDKRGCVFPMVIWPEFRMGQFRVNDHPYHAPQFSLGPYCHNWKEQPDVIIFLICKFSPIFSIFFFKKILEKFYGKFWNLVQIPKNHKFSTHKF